MEMQTQLNQYLRELCLPAMRESYPEVARQALAEPLSFEQFLLELARREAGQRRERRIERLRQEARLPSAKRLESFEQRRLPPKVRLQVAALLDGGFLSRRENGLAFWQPRSGDNPPLLGLCPPLAEPRARGGAWPPRLPWQ